MMLLVLYLLWIVLNGRVTADVCVSGLPVAALVWLFCRRFMASGLPAGSVLLKNAVRLTRYILLLVVAIFEANIQVIALVLAPELRIRPCIIRFQPALGSRYGRVLLANSITLTPGTVTGILSDESLAVHALSPRVAGDIRQSAFIRLIAEMEGEA